MRDPILTWLRQAVRDEIADLPKRPEYDQKQLKDAGEALRTWGENPEDYVGIYQLERIDADQLPAAANDSNFGEA